jgi:FAD synthase
MVLEFTRHLREQQTFADGAALAAQLHRDVDAVRAAAALPASSVAGTRVRE